jgi:hypothetical protein
MKSSFATNAERPIGPKIMTRIDVKQKIAAKIIPAAPTRMSFCSFMERSLIPLVTIGSREKFVLKRRLH